MISATIKGPVCVSGVGTSLTSIGGYTPAVNVFAVVSELAVANTTTAPVTVSVGLWNGSTIFYLAKNVLLPVGGTLTPPGTLTLTNGWFIQIISSVASSIDGTMSVTEYA